MTACAANALPKPAGVSELVTMLVGKRVAVTSTTPLAVAGARGIATYVDASEKLLFVAITDLAFLAGVGAALAMIPQSIVTEAIKAGKLSSVLLENAFEVMNIVASLYNDPDGKGSHVKIHKLVVAPPLAPELVARLAKPAARLDLDVQLPGYANGKLTLLALS